jgi:protein SCO1/2
MNTFLRWSRWTAAIGVSAIALTAFLTRTPADGVLPFYSSVDFLPDWRGTTHHVGEFSLVNQTGATFSNADLDGRIHLASFIYTRCSGVCPTLVSSLRRVDRAVRDTRFRIVSYSVTPDLDPPAVLAEFGAERGIDPSRWILATGEKATIFRLARESYFASDEVISKTLADPNGFLHTEKLLLVDGHGKLRGVYDGTLPSDVDHAIADIKVLLGL